MPHKIINVSFIIRHPVGPLYFRISELFFSFGTTRKPLDIHDAGKQ